DVYKRQRLQCIDLRAEKPLKGLAPSVRTALQQTVAAGEQALVFINRRGYAPVVACDACGWLSVCARCAAFAAFHKTDGHLHCHHCGWSVPAPPRCPTCGNPALAAVGHGTQRIEEALEELLPGARIERIDSDTTRRRGEANARLAAVHAGHVDVLVGTQMIAKGHDFRRVTLVAVLNADAQLVAHDFRAPERLFATLMQVAGRAGRAGQPSRVLVQTRFPDHPLYAALAAADYTGFATQQLAERRAAGMPPFVAQALLTAQGTTMARALEFLSYARTVGHQLPGSDQVAIYDPVPMPLSKLAGVHRAQLLTESSSRRALQDWLSRWRAALRQTAGGGIRWHLEVDPMRI
ncbi:MAG: primosomal protein N', partial [Burkholderiaceae bacterium]|nr:primosomal protein N' [Burkholderiaceae bacterium]